jgi:hypothetical protein
VVEQVRFAANGMRAERWSMFVSTFSLRLIQIARWYLNYQKLFPRDVSCFSIGLSCAEEP